MLKDVSLALLFLSVLTSVASANPIDCSKAGTVTEETMCGSETLVALDDELDRAIRRLLKALPEEERPKALVEQKDWLRQRNQCRNDQPCLFKRHSDRIKMVEGKWQTFFIHKPDEVDLEAQSKFRAAIAQNMQTDKEFPLEKALGKFSIGREVTSIGGNCQASCRLIPRI